MKKAVIGILAHVDAGKTTLSESMLYLSGKIRKLGRVDNKDAYLDTYDLERERGITIFSKQAILNTEDTYITLLDTPGHIDFSAEMERTLQVLDYAVLVISGADGVQGHTQTLWRLLERYNIPTFLFINKMDQNGIEKDKLLEQMSDKFSDKCVDFNPENQDDFLEQLAMCNETLMNHYLNNGVIEKQDIQKGITQRDIFPCFFGSALKVEGVREFLEGISKYTVHFTYPEAFGGKVFKIARDDAGNRLTYMKITGGTLKIKDKLGIDEREEKVNQIRIYSGEKFEAVTEVSAGSICTLVGLTHTKIGQGFGIEKGSLDPVLEPVLSYQILLPNHEEARVVLPKLRQLEEEDPELKIIWNEQFQEIQAQIMGDVQIEVLQRIIKERFDISVLFGEGSIVYKETITNVVEGVGHFEPLKHYAEVHILLEPGTLGSGIEYATKCSEDVLGSNWQNQVLASLKGKVHKGVLTGSPITDIKLTLVSGRAHNKHTEGGDFKEATERAVRQGLKQAQSRLLEPYYQFRIELPEKMIGRAMTDIERMKGMCEVTHAEGEISIIEGSAPVVTMRNYQKEVTAYTKGHGKMFTTLKGYFPCHNEEEVIESIGYDSEYDIANPTGSIFCSHGAGFFVPWDEVEKYMHIESSIQESRHYLETEEPMYEYTYEQETTIDLDEIDAIINKVSYANQGDRSKWRKQQKGIEQSYDGMSQSRLVTRRNTSTPKEEYLLVDAYNIIFAWPELRELADMDNIEGARIKLLEMLSNYQGIKKMKIIAVFDAYKVPSGRAEIMEYLNVYMVYTKEAQTADHYIERFVHQNHHKYQVTVATSDATEQMIIRGKGCALLSARELKMDIEQMTKQVLENYQSTHKIEKNYFSEIISPELKKQIQDLTKQ